MEILFLFGVLLAAVPFVLPIMSLVRARRVASNLDQLRTELEQLTDAIARVGNRLGSLSKRVDALEARGTRTPVAQALPLVAPEIPPAVSAATAPPEPSPPSAPPPALVPSEPPQAPEQSAPSPAAITPPATAAAPSKPPLPSTPPPMSPAPMAPVPPPAQVTVDWERWLGVRGAAVLGGVVLALAALMFFKYSIEQGLISPPVRVALGTLTGLACIVVSERLRRPFAITANALAGGGAVALYASFWAAKTQYDLIPLELAFGLMALTTAVCCLLSIRRNSLLVGILGLVGGFSTPLLLASGHDRPIGLFGYVLLLDAGLLFVARKRRWGGLAALSLIGTSLLQLGWIVARMGPDRLWLGIGILALFALVFVLAGAKAPAERKSQWMSTQAGGVLLPYAFALYFAVNAHLGEHLYPTALLLGLLGAGCAWVASRDEEAMGALPVGGACATVAVVVAWLLSRALTPELVWEGAACATALALVHHVSTELERRNEGLAGRARAALIVDVGLLGSFVFASTEAAVAVPWPWLCGSLAPAILLYRLAHIVGRPRIQIVAAIGVGLGTAVFFVDHSLAADFPQTSEYLAAEVALAMGGVALAVFTRPPLMRADAGHAAAALPVLMLVGLFGAPDLVAQLNATHSSYGAGEVSHTLAFGASGLLGALAALGATLSGRGIWLFAAFGGTVLVHGSWTPPFGDLAFDGWTALAVQLACVVVATLFPRLVGRRFAKQRAAWCAAALAAPAWFSSLRRLYAMTLGDATIGALPIALGLLSLTALAASRDLWTAADPDRKNANVWFGAVAIGFASIAIPLQLERHWITIGWALEAFGVLALWKRLDHPGLKIFGLALIGIVTVRLVSLPSDLGESARDTAKILNWTLYAYWVPAVAFLLSAGQLAKLEVERARVWERDVYAREQPIGAVMAAGCALLVFFVWINVAIADWFSSGARIVFSFEREPARDLTTSIAWTLYAVFLLSVGVLRSSRGLRWVSLFMLVLTIGKVFLYDLGNLKDLYRVVSLLGLAVSLIGVSLAYQRFVFRSPRAETEKA